MISDCSHCPSFRLKEPLFKTFSSNNISPVCFGFFVVVSLDRWCLTSAPFRNTSLLFTFSRLHLHIVSLLFRSIHCCSPTPTHMCSGIMHLQHHIRPVLFPYSSLIYIPPVPSLSFSPLPPCCFFVRGLRCLGHSELLKKASPCTGLCGLVYTAHYSQYKRLNKHAYTITDISTVGEWVWTHLKGVKRLVKVTDCPHVWHFTNSSGLFLGKKQDTSHLLTQSNKGCFHASHNSGVSLTQQMHMTRSISSYIILCWGSINCCLCVSAWGYAGVVQVFTGHRRKWVMLSSDRLSAALTPRYFFQRIIYTYFTQNLLCEKIFTN